MRHLRSVFVEREAPYELWETLRVIRNECAADLTHFQAEITPAMQELYRRTYHENVRHYLYQDPATGEYVGFARLEYRGGRTYPTYGVRASARGKGYGKTVVQFALMAAGTELAGDLLDVNEKIKKIDYALGWVPVGPVHEGVQDVECAWPPPFLVDPLDWWREGCSGCSHLSECDGHQCPQRRVY